MRSNWKCAIIRISQQNLRGRAEGKAWHIRVAFQNRPVRCSRLKTKDQFMYAAWFNLKQCEENKLVDYFQLWRQNMCKPKSVAKSQANWAENCCLQKWRQICTALFSHTFLQLWNVTYSLILWCDAGFGPARRVMFGSRAFRAHRSRWCRLNVALISRLQKVVFHARQIAKLLMDLQNGGEFWSADCLPDLI
jgi:hypothetical protein